MRDLQIYCGVIYKFTNLVNNKIYIGKKKRLKDLKTIFKLQIVGRTSSSLQWNCLWSEEYKTQKIEKLNSGARKYWKKLSVIEKNKKIEELHTSYINRYISDENFRKEHKDRVRRQWKDENFVEKVKNSVTSPIRKYLNDNFISWAKNYGTFTKQDLKKEFPDLTTDILGYFLDSQIKNNVIIEIRPSFSRFGAIYDLRVN